MGLLNTVAAELIKLRSLPAVAWTVCATTGVSIALAAGIAFAAEAPTTPLQTIAAIVPFLQVGLILLGVVTAAAEYEGDHIRTTLTATPSRRRLLLGKALAFVLVATVASATAIGAGLVTAAIALASRNMDSGDALNGWAVAGAGAYLLLIGLLSVALTVLLRSLIAPLVLMLGLVLIASPLVGRVTEHARWLPDQAGGLLYRPAEDAVLTAWTGALVLIAWITVAGIAATAAFVKRDA